MKNLHGLYNYSILHNASQFNHHEVVKVILNSSIGRGLLDDASHDFNDTPLTSATKFDGDLDLVADTKKVGSGKAPLQWALEKEKPDIVKYLKHFETHKLCFYSYLK